MRRALTLIASLTVALPLWAGTFEGNVSYEMHLPDGKVQNMNYQIKNPNFRMNMEVPGQGTSAMLFIPAENAMYVLMDEKKMAMKQSLPDAQPAKSKATTAKKMEFTKTGRKETIAGHECTVFTYKNETSEGEVCNAEGMGAFFFGGAGRGGAEAPAWVSEARAKGLFPLRTMNKDLKSGHTMTMVATKIEAKSLPASLFKVPADYQMIQGMRGAAGTPPPAAGSAPMSGQSDLAQKMMNATPEERQKMIEEMRKKYAQ